MNNLAAEKQESRKVLSKDQIEYILKSECQDHNKKNIPVR